MQRDLVGNRPYLVSFVGYGIAVVGDHGHEQLQVDELVEV